MGEAQLDPDNLPVGDHEAHRGVSYMPSTGLSYDPNEPLYWDAEALALETERVIEVCHGCRMCFKYCSTFPILFEAIDEQHNGRVELLERATIDRAFDACFQCKLCEVQCPYTPRDGHEFQLDLPKLIHRHDAQRAAAGRKRSFRDRLLGDPDRAARLARLSLGGANIGARVRPLRVIQEKTLGIHRDASQPAFAFRTFDKRAAKRGLTVTEPTGDVVLFQTCFVQHNDPGIGEDVLDVLAHNGVATDCRKGFQCCGMPKWESGDLKGLREKAAHNLARLEPHADAGQEILVVNPTCSMMLRREYPGLVPPEQREVAEKVAAQVRDVGEYLWNRHKDGSFKTDFRSTPGETVAYHAPCHLRAQGIGFRGRDLLRRIPGVKPKMTLECSGHDGTYALKVESHADSVKAGRRAFASMRAAESDVWATECPLAALQYEAEAGTKPLHPMSILARAYREDGFPTALPVDDGGGMSD